MMTLWKEEVIIGDCRLLLGDCMKIMPLLDKVDAVVTDPPYGISYKATQPNAIDYGLIKNDDSIFDPTQFLNHGEVILWGANNYTEKLPFGGWIVWDKRVSPRADKMMGSPFELAWSNNKKLFKMIRVQHGGAKNADAENGEVANEARFHPTQKPIKVMQQCLSFLKGNSIIDPFMGSGSTGIACIKMGKSFIGIEIDKAYFDIACQRISDAYSQPDMLINMGIVK